MFTFALVSELAADPAGSTTAESGATRDVSDARAKETLGNGGTTGGDSSRRAEGVEGVEDAGPSPAAFARAARELLAAAGAPMPSDAERMLAAHQELRADLAAAAAAAAAAERSEKETRAKAAAAASAFLCPITQTAMADPVLAMDGHTYERAAIERWFANGRAASPVTNARLASTMLVPNHALKSARAAFEDVRGEAAGEDALNDRRTG